MAWDTIMSNWPDLTDRLLKGFPHLNAAALERFRGDRLKLVAYIAETHDLTRREADEVLFDWQMRVNVATAPAQAA
ncbi:MAG: hypothetical protein AAGL89_10285 [Pseudomonadota bacterium]